MTARPSAGKGYSMNEDLKALAGNNEKDSTAGNGGAGFDFSAFAERLNRLEEKIDKIIELSSKDVKIDESNSDKVSITEAEGKINENEEYRDADEEKGE